MESMARPGACAQPLDTHNQPGSKKRSERVAYGVFLRLVLSSSTTRCGLLLAMLFLGRHDAKHLQARTKVTDGFSFLLLGKLWRLARSGPRSWAEVRSKFVFIFWRRVFFKVFFIRGLKVPDPLSHGAICESGHFLCLCAENVK